ncbi:MAG: M20/M25/M40 family metallo-hydrolase [Clostridia bacterium]|nr:M20/M25/M40 family metallo-hydrolase [Clostridia bacterium]
MSYQVGQKTKEAFEKLIAIPEVKKGFDFIKEDSPNTLKDQLELVVIKAPTFQEENRAKAVAEKFRALGLEDVHLDEIWNAIGVYKGTGGAAPIVVEAHMDTVFPMETVIEPVMGDDGFIRCPGIGDNTSGTAALMGIIRAFKETGIKLKSDIYFVGTVREEGIGGFGGIEHFLNAHPEVSACVCLDGVQVGKITYQSTGMTTCEVTFYGIGGHAYGAFGLMANPLHAAARAVAKIADIVTPLVPKTTYCVSNFHAGNDAGVHAIVPEATIKINMRSNGQKELDELKEKVYAAIKAGAEEETARWGKDTITYKIHEYFNVPAGTLDRNDPIVEGIYTIMQYMGKDPIFNEGGPTDAAFPICRGIPAVCIGSGDIETHSHSAANERFPVAVMHQGPQAGFLLAILCGGIEGKFESII